MIRLFRKGGHNAGVSQVATRPPAPMPMQAMRGQIPALGRIVHYRLTAADALTINALRKEATRAAQWHHGNDVREGQAFAMLIVAVHGDTPDSYVNGQAFLDGDDHIWVTSVKVGDEPGTFAWPARA